MAKQKLSERLKEGVFILDGAMGTQLMAAGIGGGRCNEYLNVDSPGIVSAIHENYFQAGSDAVITNTIGANRISLKRHGHENDVKQICIAGAEIARKAVDDKAYILGGSGPCGEFLEPLGTLSRDKLRSAIIEQAEALIEGGVDGIIIETVTAADEMSVIVEAFRSVTDLPVLASFSFDAGAAGPKTMMGVDPAGALRTIQNFGISAFGFNCGTMEMDEYVTLAELCRNAIGDEDILLMAEPNAGKPELLDDKALYSLSPKDFAVGVLKIKEAGATVLGGCCGTGPEHIKALREQIKK